MAHHAGVTFCNATTRKYPSCYRKHSCDQPSTTAWPPAEPLDLLKMTSSPDRLAAFDAFDQDLAISPSSSLALSFGAVTLAYAGETERVIEWAQRALRISPLDRLNNLTYHALAVAHFLRGDYQESANSARRVVQIQPRFSVSYCLLAAALATLERRDQAKAAAQQALMLEPSFGAGGFCVALGLPAAVTESPTRAWLDAGLPE